MTPDQIAEMTPSQLAPLVGSLLSGLERMKLTAAQKAALDAALALDVDNRPLILGDAGDVTVAQLAALLAGGGLNVALLSIDAGGLSLNGGNGPTTLTVDVGGDAAVLTFSDAGVAITRDGALAATLGLGGGNIADPGKVADAIVYALCLLIDQGDFGAAPALRFKGPMRTLAQDHFNPGTPMADYLLRGARGVVVESTQAITLTVGAGVGGLTVD